MKFIQKWQGKNCRMGDVFAASVPGNIQYDFAVARAVANLPVLSEYCIPYVKVGGSFVALKGASANTEAEAADKAIKVLGGKLESVDCFSLLDSGERGIITVKKISQTPPKYPRNPGKISKQPL
jgi:16S rRNA (guanine527-N7)-methyltransferase